MSLLHVSGLAFRHPSQPDWLFHNVSFDVNPRDRVGLIGTNGTGKTTLLRLLTGEIEQPDEQPIVRRKALRIAHARQIAHSDAQSLTEHAMSANQELHGLQASIARLELKLDHPDMAIEYAASVSEYAERGGYEFEARIAQVLAGLGFSKAEYVLPLRNLSGGQRTRAELARILLAPADLILLDEPTNHLDVAARDWLDRYIATLDAAVLAVSHDRRFLQSTASRIFELRRSRLSVYSGTYEWYRAQRRHEEQQAWERFHAQERRARATTLAAEQRMRVAHSVARTPSGIRRGKDFYAAKAAKVQRTAKVILARTQREPAANKPVVDEPMTGLLFPEFTHPSNPVIAAHGIAKRFDDKSLFADFSLEVTRGQRIAITGANGTGKTTLLRILLGDIAPDAGSIAISDTARVGYFAQDSADLALERSPVDLCMEGSDDATRVHTMLGCLRIPQRQLHRPTRELSAGERAKVALAKLMLTAPNVLVLDEPTNHLDIDAQEAIEEAIAAYPGTILLVSHDRALVDRATDTTIDLAYDPTDD